MENTINLIEINTNLSKENNEKLVETYLLQNDFIIINKDNKEVIYYGGNNSKIFGSHFWNFYIEDNKIYLISYVYYKNKEYSYNHKLFSTDINGINYKRFDLNDMKNISAYAIETFINYIKSNNLVIEVIEKVIDINEYNNLFNSKNKFLPKINGYSEEMLKKDNNSHSKVKYNFIKFITFFMPIISFVFTSKLLLSIVLSCFALLFLINNFKKNTKKLSRIISIIGIIGNGIFLILYVAMLFV